MVKKRSVKRKSSTRKTTSYPVYFSRKIIFFISLLIAFAGLAFFTQTKTWYFLTTGKEKIDFTTATGAFNQEATIAYYENQTIPLPPSQQLLSSDLRQPLNVLGDATGSNKRIEVDLTNQRLYAFEGGTKVYDFLVSTGLWGKTPTGTFHIWTKFPAVLMRGGNKALGTYYYLPNVPWTMFFSNSQVPSWRGFGIHGTYWHSNFGHPMSHGCINMKTEEAAILYQWAQPTGSGSVRATTDNPGTEVVIYGVAPSS
jgi:lipoprotein-anchoring transpeptidase ErfK/SrfK